MGGCSNCGLSRPDHGLSGNNAINSFDSRAATSKDATSVREHHLGFHARVVIVLSIDITENLEGQVAGAVGGSHTPNPELVLHLSRELRNIVFAVWKQVESAFD